LNGVSQSLSRAEGKKSLKKQNLYLHLELSPGGGGWRLTQRKKKKKKGGGTNRVERERTM